MLRKLVVSILCRTTYFERRENSLTYIIIMHLYWVNQNFFLFRIDLRDKGLNIELVNAVGIIAHKQAGVK